MASSSNPPDASLKKQDLEYLYASNTNVSNFVSVKLSGDGNYHLWKKQMLCLMKAHDMCGLVDDSKKFMNKYDSQLVEKYDSLLQGWIYGSVSEQVLRVVVNDKSARDVWRKLESCFESTMSSEQDSAPTKANTKTKMKDENMVLGEIATNKKDMNPAECEAEGEKATHVKTKDSAPTEADKNIETKGENPETKTQYKDETYVWKRESLVKRLRQYIVYGEWDNVYDLLINNRDAIAEKINSDGNTALHIAVGIRCNEFIKRILWKIDNDLTELKNKDGSTVLHIAAIVGNSKAAELLVSYDKRLIEKLFSNSPDKKGQTPSMLLVDKDEKLKIKLLLHTPDNKGQTPLDKAYENMHLDTIVYLLDATEVHLKQVAVVEGTGNIKSSLLPTIKRGVDLLANAISAKQYDFASTLMSRNPEYAVSNDNVLMAIAKTFPSGLNYWETLIHPSFDNIPEMIVGRTKWLFHISIYIPAFVKQMMWYMYTYRWKCKLKDIVVTGLVVILSVLIAMVYCIYCLLLLLMLMVYFTFFMLYFLPWKFAALVVPCIKNIERKKKAYEGAKKVLESVCWNILEMRPYRCRDLYKQPFLEAACQDAYEVVDEILRRWPDAIRCKDKNGYDIIQLATIYRSEKIYNLIYIIGERKSVYGTTEDSCKNNMLHLAARLAPLNKLKLKTGAALQLQRELQWYKEVQKLVFPTYVTKENIFMETPAMIFTKEHETLVKDGEQWMKTVAESSSITAALITTIVFAAAITVPGGSNQDTGVPLFDKQIAFTIFAISNAISLFFSATALLVFLSILTARFAEQDFLVRLPRRLIIGLCTLLISTTAMMVAFSATLYLVFSHHKLWVLGSICGLAFVPISFFFILQFPLMLDLFSSTYISKFGKSKKSTFNPTNVRFFFGK